MKRLLLASVAICGLALAPAAFAQLPVQVPASPPIVAPQVGGDAATRTTGRVGGTAGTAQTQAGVTGDAEAATNATAPRVSGPAGAAVQGNAETAAPDVVGSARTTGQTAVQGAARTTTPTPQAQVGATAGATGNVATPSVNVESTASAARAATANTARNSANTAGAATANTARTAADATAQATTQSAAAVPMTAAQVCQARTTSVHFGARGSALNTENRNALEYAVDGASVCSLQQVVIRDSGEGRVSARRTAAVRSALIQRGVPEDKISVEHSAEADASTGQLDVRMDFAGNATAAASPEAANPTTPRS